MLWRCQMRRLYVFFFNDTATTEIYTLSLHDALPIFDRLERRAVEDPDVDVAAEDPALDVVAREAQARLRQVVRAEGEEVGVDRKSTRLNSSHANISYAVFCLKKKH